MQVKLVKPRIMQRFFNVLHKFLFLISYLAFGIFTLVLILNYTEEKTGYTVDIEEVEELRLPSITVCTAEGFKDVNTSIESTYLLQNLDEVSFKFEEIFNGKYNYFEIFSPRDGRCFTLHEQETITKLSKKKLANYKISPETTSHLLKVDQNVSIDILVDRVIFAIRVLTFQVYLHEEGAEFLMQLKQYLTDVPAYLMDTHDMLAHGTSRVKLVAKKVVTEHIDRKQYSCNKGINLKAFTQCAYEECLSQMENISCNAVIPVPGVKLKDANICQTPKTLSAAYTTMKKEMIRIIEAASKKKHKCELPCHKINYEADLQKVHKNAKLLLDPESISSELENIFLGVEYQELTVKHNVEYLVLDLNSLVSAIGGFLGLFLGHCALSLSESCCSLMAKKFTK